MIEITGSDISNLNDTDLRSLIGLLCEAATTYFNWNTDCGCYFWRTSKC